MDCDPVQILFAKTVGPVKDTFIVYNSQGKSKGMAVVAFAKPESAALAREKYNGKIVDGRRPIKIEIIKDDNEIPSAAPEKKSLSLLERIGQTSKSAKLRTKKGPKRIQKQQQRKVVTAEQLDQEMEDYRASTDTV
ncbi:uncharacterized protein B0H18DRAFT_879310 [Fomitopsis serialis]|uniref:uncharacterized protein n=1 Tax=Fomitopsis serialis TaxID=139415 RepID=UPI00200771E6|nr:uncharacterized protein B0H18DRAFT_879310 [Neoantrodia serialis]KAH9922537.1 hypothetical protein B0H18DRAFT_879310 [Neoantrodia serialis]